MEVLQQTGDLVLVSGYSGSEGDDQHNLPFVVVAEDECAEQSFVGVLVVETEAVFNGILPYGIADAVVDLRHEVAGLYVQHFVERTGDMKSNTIYHLVIYHLVIEFLELLGGEPFAVGA